MSQELDSVAEVARHAAVKYPDTCSDPGVRPQTNCACSHLAVAMVTRQVPSGELRQRRTEQHRRPVADDDILSIFYSRIIFLPELQLHHAQLMTHAQLLKRLANAAP